MKSSAKKIVINRKHSLKAKKKAIKEKQRNKRHKTKVKQQA